MCLYLLYNHFLGSAVNEMMVFFCRSVEKVIKKLVIIQKAASGERLGKAHYGHSEWINVVMAVDVKIIYKVMKVKYYESPKAIVQVGYWKHSAFFVLLNLIGFDVNTSYFQMVQTLIRF
jgi:hypothetical protein